MTKCKGCKHDPPNSGYRRCLADRLRLQDCDESIRIVYTDYEKSDDGGKK